MFLCRLRQAAFLLAVLASVVSVHAQYEVPQEMAFRSFLIKVRKEKGAAFKFDYDGRIYLVTTRKLAERLPLRNPTLQVWRDGGWNDIKMSRILFPESNDVELAVFETEERIGQPYTVKRASGDSAAPGQSVWLIGSPPPVPAAMGFVTYPMIGIGTISAIDVDVPDSLHIHVSRPYGAAMAGGPIVFWNSKNEDYEILGVVKAPTVDASKNRINRNPKETQTATSFVLSGYSIDYVIQTITRASSTPPRISKPANR